MSDSGASLCLLGLAMSGLLVSLTSAQFAPGLGLAASPPAVGKFGRPPRPTTVDPISEILSNVVIVDVDDYLPPNYYKKLAEQASAGDDEIEGSGEDDEPEPTTEATATTTTEASTTTISPKLALFGPKKPEPTRPGKPASFPPLDEGFLPDPRPLKSDGSIGDGSKVDGRADDDEFELNSSDADDLFEAILNGGGLPELGFGTETTTEKTTTSTTPSTTTSTTTATSTSTTTTTTTTTTTVRSTTPGSCGEYCSLAGTLLLLSGLDWDDRLSHHGTEEFRLAARYVGGNLTKTFGDSLVGSALDSVRVEAFSPLDSHVLVDFYLNFNGLVFDVDTRDLRDLFVEGLRLKVVDNATADVAATHMGPYRVAGDHLDLIVTGTEVPVVLNHVEILDVVLPDWAWVVIIGGSASVLAVAVFGCVIAFGRYWGNRNSQNPKELTQQTLNDLKEGMTYDTLDLEYDSIYRKDYWKNDIWTWAKMNDYATIRTVKSTQSGLNRNQRTSTMNTLPILPEASEAVPPKNRSSDDSKSGLLNGYAEFYVNQSFEI